MPQREFDLAEEQRQIAKIMRTPDGKLLRDHLTALFNQDRIVGVDTHDTYFHLGQRDVCIYLDNLAEEEAET